MTRREREVTDPVEIKRILDTARIVHIGLVDDGMPYVLPMNYGYEMTDRGITLYMHGAMKGYKLDVIRKNPICCFEIDCNIEPFNMDEEKPCTYGTTYESVIGRGRASIIEDPERKMRDLSIFMKCQTGRDFEFNEKLVSAVAIIEIHSTDFTAKRRPMPEGMRGTH